MSGSPVMGPGFLPGNLVPDLTDVDAFAGDALLSAAIDAHAPWSREAIGALSKEVWARDDRPGHGPFPVAHRPRR